MNIDNIVWLTTVPANDGNFKNHLQIATLEELEKSISVLEEKGTKGNVSKLNAINREIRKRHKNA